MTTSPRRKVLILSALMLLPALICWGIAVSLVRAQDLEFSGGLDAEGVVEEVLENRVRFNGRNSEEVTEVRVRYTPAESTSPAVATAEVYSAADMRRGDGIHLRYLPAKPEQVLLRAGFWSRTPGVVFLTLFGGFWLALDLALTAVLWRVTRGLGPGASRA